MKKICYRPVYNRKKQLNSQGKALLQIEAYLEKRKVYFSTHIYLLPEQWDNRRKLIKQHPHAESLNYQIKEFIMKLEEKELSLWRNGRNITLESLKEEFRSKTSQSFLSFIKEDIENAQAKESTKQNRFSTYTLLYKFKSHIEFKDLTPRFVYDFEKFLFDNNFKTNTVANT